MSYLQRARELFDDAVVFRRQLHKNPEIGFDLPMTEKAIKAKLDEFGIAYENLGDTYAVIGTLGDPSKGKTLLLRADSDALEIPELSEHDFVSEIEGRGHLCGHDMHTTILLVVLKMLKENVDKLEGQIKFLFQPAEETLIGGKVMVEQGILENPKPDAGMALHMMPTFDEVGVYVSEKEVLASAINFSITVKGEGAHGAMPYTGKDPVYLGAKIIDALDGIISRELPSNKGASMSTGFVETPGGAVNVIPETMTIRGTSRSLYPESAAHVAKRIPEIVKYLGLAFNMETEYEVLAEVPVLINTPEMSQQVLQAAKEALGDEYPIDYTPPQLASEDYAHIASKLPESCYFVVGCPLPDKDGKVYAVHNPKVQFNEEALILGSATMTQAAINWLRDNK